jgi:hypothetical protein
MTDPLGTSVGGAPVEKKRTLGGGIVKRQDALTAERLREVLSYDPLSGIFRWLISTGPRAKVGAIAGNIDDAGYRTISINSVPYKANRLAWLFMTGNWPVNDVDHEDTDRANNIFTNLREATRSQNCANKRPMGRLGVKGVTLNHGRYQAQIKVKGKNFHLGYFDKIEDAAAAYIIAAKRHFGAFARS